ncbi:hypothetical protein ACFQ9X_50940 [Catenulispora yoronensis]
MTAERLRIAEGLDADLATGLGRIREQAAEGEPAVLDDLLAGARATLAATRATAADLRSLSLAPEAASARALLRSAGIEATVVTGHTEPLGPAGTVLATVLREVVTAVVRVGDARRCRIVTGEDGGQVTLRVLSDGVPPRRWARTCSTGSRRGSGAAADGSAPDWRRTAGSRWRPRCPRPRSPWTRWRRRSCGGPPSGTTCCWWRSVFVPCFTFRRS